MVRALSILIFNGFLLGAALSVLHGEASSDGMQDGRAIITSRSGEVVLKDLQGRQQHAEQHAVLNLSGVEVTSQRGDYAFFSLSNGSALGIYENSKVRFESYQQRPFSSGKESLEYEPTNSKLVIELQEGSLSFSAEHLSPISEMRIKLPKGQIQVHKASGRVQYDGSATLITITSGIVTYHYPEMDKQEFINSPNSMRISNQAALAGRSTPFIDPDSDPSSELTSRLVNATHRSRGRVTFMVKSKEASIPEPVLVATPESLLKPTTRPYIYRD